MVIAYIIAYIITYYVTRWMLKKIEPNKMWAWSSIIANLAFSALTAVYLIVITIAYFFHVGPPKFLENPPKWL